MLNAVKLSAVILATGIALHAVVPHASAQTSNVVIQWNETLQTQFVGTGPGIHIRALPMMHIAMFDAINSIEERSFCPRLRQLSRVRVTPPTSTRSQTSFTSKFTYGLWRPVTAIRRAGEDLNPATDQEGTWTPLLNTPTYPSYAGNAACLSAASARALQIAFGRDDFRLPSPTLELWACPPKRGLTRDYRILRSRKQTVASLVASIIGSTMKPVRRTASRRLSSRLNTSCFRVTGDLRRDENEGTARWSKTTMVDQRVTA